MINKPKTAAEYSSRYVELVKRTCLYLATILGNFQDDLVIVGGLVPTLLIPEGSLPENEPAHVGTTDLDIGLHIALLNGQRYEGLTERIRRAGFENDVNDEGNVTRQRWINSKYGLSIKVDLLIQPINESEEGGKLRNIERDFAAVITPGLHLVFRDREKIILKGITIAGEMASREIWVCGPGAFLVLKALAFKFRGEMSLMPRPNIAVSSHISTNVLSAMEFSRSRWGAQTIRLLTCANGEIIGNIKRLNRIRSGRF